MNRNLLYQKLNLIEDVFEPVTTMTYPITPCNSPTNNINVDNHVKINHKRCNKCRRKTSLIDREMQCKCGYTHCTLHIFAKSHDCDYDFKQDRSSKLFKYKLIANKVDII
jgi:hypothetical protein